MAGRRGGGSGKGGANAAQLYEVDKMNRMVLGNSASINTPTMSPASSYTNRGSAIPAAAPFNMGPDHNLPLPDIDFDDVDV